LSGLGGDAAEVAKRHHTDESTLARELKGDLDWITLKAMEKDRTARYPSASELAEDVIRHLKQDPIRARPASLAYRVRKLVGKHRLGVGATVAAALGVMALAAGSYLAWRARAPATSDTPTALNRVTFDDGLQAQPTWSPDGRFIAYASDQGGNFDIWVQPVTGGRAVQVTTDPANDWQPVWSPDGNNLAFRSERGGGGIFVVPALGGRERQVATFGYWPEWRPKQSELLFVVRPPLPGASRVVPFIYLVGLDGKQPRRILADAPSKFLSVGRITWHPDGQRISFPGSVDGKDGFWNVPVSGGEPVRAEVSNTVEHNLDEADLSIISSR
jgi:hypothetical protein